MKKGVLIAIGVIILLVVGVTIYFVSKGGEESTSVPGGDYSVTDEEIDYAAGTGVGDNLAEGTQSNIFEDVETNPFA